MKNFTQFKKPNLVKLKKLDIAKAKTLDYVKINSSKVDFLITKANKTFLYLQKILPKHKFSIILNQNVKLIETEVFGFAIYALTSWSVRLKSKFLQLHNNEKPKFFKTSKIGS